MLVSLLYGVQLSSRSPTIICSYKLSTSSSFIPTPDRERHVSPSLHVLSACSCSEFPFFNSVSFRLSSELLPSTNTLSNPKVDTVRENLYKPLRFIIIYVTNIIIFKYFNLVNIS